MPLGAQFGDRTASATCKPGVQKERGAPILVCGGEKNLLANVDGRKVPVESPNDSL